MPVPANSLVLLAAALAVVIAAAVVWRAATQGRGRKIRVVGVGGAGANAVQAMIAARLKGVEYIVVNTDARALRRSSASTRIAIGRQITNGLGAGGDAGAGEVAARDATDQLGRALAGSDFVIITAGLGGGTGTGAAPVVAEIARQKGALTMAVVTTPFGFEGSRRRDLAQRAATTLAGRVDAVATIPNDRARDGAAANATMEDAFRAIDEMLCRTVGEILDLVSAQGRMNLDLADVRGVLQGGGMAAVGIGRAAGENRAVEAARGAMTAAMPAGRAAGPSAVLVNISASNKLRLAEVDAVAETVLSGSARDASLVLGMSVRPRLRDEVQVTVIATGVGTMTSADAGATEVAAEAASVAGSEAAVHAAADAAADADAAWKPVWLRRAPADERRVTPRARRKGVPGTGTDPSPASESTGADHP